MSISERPPFAILGMNEVIELRRVLDLQVFAVPLEPPARRLESEHAQEHDLGQRAGVIEVGDRPRASLAGLRPILRSGRASACIVLGTLAASS